MDDERHIKEEVIDMMKMNDHNDQLTFKLMSLNINSMDNDLISQYHRLWINFVISQYHSFKIVPDS